MRCLGLLVLVAVAMRLAAQTPEDLALTAARKRQEKFRMLEVRFKRTDDVRKGALSAMIGASETKQPALPATDSRIESVNRVVLDGKRFRYESRHPVFNIESGTWAKVHDVNATNGKIAKTIHDNGPGVRPTGRIEGVPRCHRADDVILSPLACFYRWADPMLCAYPIMRFKPTGEKQSVAGKECLVYSFTRGTFAVKAMIDPALDHLARRVQSWRNGKLDIQTDISYGPVGGFAVFPRAWTISFMNPDGRLRESRNLAVLEVRVPEAVPDAEFEIEFPPNTLYHDRRDAVTYEISKDGKPVPSRLSPGTAEGSQGSVWERSALWIALAGCLISALLYVLISWRMKQARTS